MTVSDGDEQILSEPHPVASGGHDAPNREASPRSRLRSVDHTRTVAQMILPWTGRAEVTQDGLGAHPEDRGRARVVADKRPDVVATVDEPADQRLADQTRRPGYEDRF